MNQTHTTHTTRTPAVLSLLLFGLLFCLALAPRVLGVGTFVTSDENLWFDRSEAFGQALRTGDYARTNQAGHPGVTTMWLGAAGRWLHGSLTDRGGDGSTPEDPHDRALLRLPVAVVTALCIALAFPLLRRLFDLRVALLAGVLWATDPFLVAHSQLLHVDALLASLMTLSLLAAMVASFSDGATPPAPACQRMHPRIRLVVASAVAGGLALLTKSPSVLLLPMVALATFLGTKSLWKTLQTLLLWGGTALGIWVALWPFAWVDLPGAVQRVWNEVAQNGATPHGGGNFFLGHPVDDPGLLFYPVALVLRLTPWTLAGLLAAAVAARPRRQTNQTRATLAVSLLILSVLLLLIALSVPSKKFDRYFLPASPALVIVAAAGWVRLWERWEQWEPSSPFQFLRLLRLPHLPHLLFLSMSLLATITTAWYHPYELAYYNPLVGGGSVAMQTILVGWGEGLEQAGDYLAAHSDDCDRPVLAWRAKKLGYFIGNPVLASLDASPDPVMLDYAVLYVNVAQRNAHDGTIRRAVGDHAASAHHPYPWH
ncbi:MAG: phospholipid carrier-dependent glycosyltransferase [Chloroflexaceae bacterium]|nr:phospholipid carrier-dependent glycosyltransferase [Chloroflexaceae bacterium]